MNLRCKQIIPLFKHQLRTVVENENRNYFGLLFDTGTGKSATTISIIREKFAKEKRFFKTLIICPLSILNQWKKEWVVFGGETYQDKITVVTGTGLQKMKALKGDTPIYITNIDSVNSKTILAELLKMDFECIVVDESHQIKSYKAARSKNVTKLGDKAKYRYILTGTPQTNGIGDLWSQYNFLCPGEVFHKNFFVFRAQYFYDKNTAARHRMGKKYFPDYVIRPGAMEEIMQLIHKVSHVVKKEECIDLPPLIKVERYVEMTPEQKRLYNEMEKDFIACLDDKQSIAPMAMTKGLRLQQLIAGIFKDDTGMITKIDNNRQKVLKEILEEINPNEKKIIWTSFIATYKDIEKVCKELGQNCVMLTGQQTSKEKQDNIDKFKDDKDCNILIANQASGGTGLNLTEASYSIYYTRTFNLEHDMQSEARNYRSGSSVHDKITRIDIVTPNTIDVTILKALRAKKQVHEVLINYKGGKYETNI